MQIDLHSHSTCSDGTCAPAELVALAYQAQVQMLALTDHDTIMGLEEARKAANLYGMRFINGVEISCHHTLVGGYGKNVATTKIIHVVALNFTDTDTLHQQLQDLQLSRKMRGKQMVEKLTTILVQENKISVEQATAFWQYVVGCAGGNPKAVGRSHIAQVALQMGVAKTTQEVFDKWIADNKPAYVPIQTMNMQQTITLIHRCGGLAVLAHPTRYGLSATRVRRLIQEFALCGGNAVELPNLNEPISTRAMIDRCVSLHELMVSVGSDFHGSTMPWRHLGKVAKPTQGQIGIWEKF